MNNYAIINVDENGLLYINGPLKIVGDTRITANNNTLLNFIDVGNATNYFEISNTRNPIIAVNGINENIDIEIKPKNGIIKLFGDLDLNGNKLLNRKLNNKTITFFNEYTLTNEVHKNDIFVNEGNTTGTFHIPSQPYNIGLQIRIINLSPEPLTITSTQNLILMTNKSPIVPPNGITNLLYFKNQYWKLFGELESKVTKRKPRKIRG